MKSPDESKVRSAATHSIVRLRSCLTAFRKNHHVICERPSIEGELLW